MNRRTFLKTSSVMTAGAGLLGLGNSTAWADDRAGSTPHADKLGWRLGCQAWTFHTSTFHDAMDNTAALGLHVIEAFPGQSLSAEKPNEKIGPQLSMEARKEVKKRLADKGLKLVNFGVGPANKEAFDFAKDMGIETLFRSRLLMRSTSWISCARSIRSTWPSTTTRSQRLIGARTSCSRPARAIANASAPAATPVIGCARTSTRSRP